VRGEDRRARSRGRATEEVWIAFAGRAEMAWLRLFRPGFRHCFAALADAEGWTLVDPLSGRLVVQRLAAPRSFDLPGFWRRAGFRVLGPFTPAPPRRSWLPPLLPATCVTACLALLGKRHRFLFSPYALYRTLSREMNGKPLVGKNTLTGPANPG
jgi:hypothetical protein